MVPPFDEFNLMMAYHKHLSNPKSEEYYDAFRILVLKYFGHSPHDCLKLIERYRNDWMFKLIFIRTIAVPLGTIDLSMIDQSYYSNVVKWLFDEIINSFLLCCNSNEPELKIKIELIFLLIKYFERISLDLKYLGINDELVKGLHNFIFTCKYSIYTITVDFKTGFYYSLFRTFNEIDLIIKSGSAFINPPSRLSESYALLWIYLKYIFMTNDMTIFSTNHPLKASVIYLVMEFWECYDLYKEIYSNRLRLLIEGLYEKNSPQLEPIVRLLERYNPRNYCGSMDPKRFPSFSKLAHYFERHPKGNETYIIWRIKAFAVLESYLIRNGREICYSRFIY